MIYNNIWYWAAIAVPRISLFSVVQLALASIAPKKRQLQLEAAPMWSNQLYLYIVLKPRQVINVDCDPDLVSDRSVYLP